MLLWFGAWLQRTCYLQDNTATAPQPQSLTQSVSVHCIAAQLNWSKHPLVCTSIHVIPVCPWHSREDFNANATQMKITVMVVSLWLKFSESIHALVIILVVSNWFEGFLDKQWISQSLQMASGIPANMVLPQDLSKSSSSNTIRIVVNNTHNTNTLTS